MRRHIGRHVNVADIVIQPMIEQPVDQMRQTRNVAQRACGVQHILRLNVIPGGYGYAHSSGDRRGSPTECERHVDMHHIRSAERATEQGIAGLGELHLLLCRDPGDQRHMMDTSSIYGSADAHQSHGMPLPFQLLRPLQRRIRRAVALVAYRIHHHCNGKRLVFMVLLLRGVMHGLPHRLPHCLPPTPGLPSGPHGPFRCSCSHSS